MQSTVYETTGSALDILQDVGTASRPDEGFGIFRLALAVTADGHKEFLEIPKYTAPQAGLSEITEEVLYHFE